MGCNYFDKCGGCTYQPGSPNYQSDKLAKFKSLMQALSQKDVAYAPPVFIGENARRRAGFVFHYKKGSLELGYNEKASHNIVAISACPLLTDKINLNLENLKSLLLEICKTPFVEKQKKGKSITRYITNGDVLVCEADNGLDIVLELKETLSMEHRMIIFEKCQNYNDFIRISHRKDMLSQSETLIEKTRPIIKIADIDVYISAGTFLQASKAGEKALVDSVLKYVGPIDRKLKIADLFCGIGTFSYPLCENKECKIVAIDSSSALLEGFKNSINKNMISNIELRQKNLFKYPLDETELKGFDVLIFDPPRAGARAQIEKVSALTTNDKPEKIIAVSCNPHSFINDANSLTDAGYEIKEITLVDQFTYSNHFELVALFVKRSYSL